MSEIETFHVLQLEPGVYYAGFKYSPLFSGDSSIEETFSPFSAMHLTPENGLMVRALRAHYPKAKFVAIQATYEVTK